MSIPIFVEFRAGMSDFSAKMGLANAEVDKLAAKGAGMGEKIGVAGKYAALGFTALAAGVAAASIKMAGDFQNQILHLQTDAGESAKNMKLVGDGILALAGKTGSTIKDLTNGMYYIESAGYHGAAALNILTAASAGAKVGNADLTTVSDALTTALNSYRIPAGQATAVTNELIATVARGKTKLEDLSGSLGTVLPAAATAHLGLSQVLAAMATMTSEGTNAHLAATYLRQTILQLSNPTAKAANEMKNLGLSAIDISSHLGPRGLTGTFDILTQAIEKHMGPAGTVLINHLKDAAGNTSAFQKILANLPPTQQTYVGALANMVGGTKSMQAALELTGPHAKVFADNVKAIQEQAKNNSAITGLSVILGTFNNTLERISGSVQALMIKFGQVLLPTATKVANWFANSITWLTQHRQAVEVLAGAVGAVLVVAFGALTAAVWGFTAALLANPITWVVTGLVALGAGLVLAYQNSATFRDIVNTAMTDVRKVAGQVFDWITNTAVPALGAAFDWITHTALPAVQSVFHSVWGAVGASIQWFINNPLAAIKARIAEFSAFWKSHGAEVKQIWHENWTAISTIVTDAWKVISTVVKVAVNALWDGVIKPAMTVITTSWKVSWTFIKDFVNLLWHGLSSSIHTEWLLVMDTIGVFLDLVTGHWKKAWDSLKKLVSDAWDGIKTLLDGLKTDAGNLLYDVGAAIIKGLVNGMKSVFNDVKNTLSDLTNLIPIHKGPAAVDAVLLYGPGQSIIGGLVNGMESQYGAVKASLGALTSGIGSTSGQIAYGVSGSGFTGTAGRGGGFGGGGGGGDTYVTVNLNGVFAGGAPSDFRTLGNAAADGVREALLAKKSSGQISTVGLS